MTTALSLLGSPHGSIAEGLGMNKTALAARGGGRQGHGWRQGDRLERPQPSPQRAVLSGLPPDLFFLSSPVCFPFGIIYTKSPPPTPTAAAWALFHTWNRTCPRGLPHLCGCRELCQERPSSPIQMSPHHGSLLRAPSGLWPCSVPTQGIFLSIPL